MTSTSRQPKPGPLAVPSEPGSSGDMGSLTDFTPE